MKQKYNILVTGCGGDIGQSIGKILKSNPLFDHVIGCDLSNENASKFIFDQVLIIPSCVSSNYLRVLEEITLKCHIDIILPISEAELRYIADCKIENTFLSKNLICANHKAMFVGFDKYETADFLRKANLPYPITNIINDIEIVDFPCILKSRNGSGSKSVFIINDQRDFDYYRHKYPEFIIQQFLDNDSEEYTCGLYRAKNNEIRTITYKRKLMGGFSGFGSVVQNEMIDALLIEIATQINLIGSINVQLRLANNVPYVFEINPRFSSTVAFRHLMGFEDVIWSIQDALGLTLSCYTKVKEGTKFYKGFNEYID